MHVIVDAFSTDLGKSLLMQIQTPISGVTRTHIDSLNMQFSRVEEARTVLYGGMAGAMMGNIGIGVLAMVFPPVAAAAGIAAVLGSILVAWRTSDDLSEKRKEEALARLERVLCDTVRRAQSQAIRQFETIGNECEKGVRDALRKATAEVEKEIADKMQSIAEQRQRSREEAKYKTDALRQILERTTNLVQKLNRIAMSDEQNSKIS